MKKAHKLIIGLTAALLLMSACDRFEKYTSIEQAYNDRVINYGMSYDHFFDIKVSPDSITTYSNGYQYSYTFITCYYPDGNVIFVQERICGINVTKP